MVLTKKQQEALEIAVQRYKNNEAYTCIAGYAGVGKSTVIKFIIAALNIDPEDVVYCTFTGKAATVLRHKGCPNAITAHKLLYYSKRLPNGKFYFKPKTRLEWIPKIIIVDEISMLPKQLWNLLLMHKIHIIACGDPEQLPPINPDTDNHVLDNPHIFLDEIMRQAQESEIIQLTMAIREGKYVNYYKGNEVQIVPKEDMVSGMYSWADQILVATNRKRNEVNNFMRLQKGYTSQEPQIGEKIICLKNAWHILDEQDEVALVNGTIGYIDNITEDVINYGVYGIPSVPIYNIDFTTENGEKYTNIMVDKQFLLANEKTLSPEQEYRLVKAEFEIPLEFNFGYAITTHRSQGSEWNKILVLEERFPFDVIEHRKHLYTACSRAAEKLVLIK